MKFNLTSAGSFYNEEDKEKLTPLGFKFEADGSFPDRPFYKTKEGDPITFQTLEELVKFAKKHGSVVLSEKEIEIYDAYRE